MFARSFIVWTPAYAAGTVASSNHPSAFARSFIVWTPAYVERLHRPLTARLVFAHILALFSLVKLPPCCMLNFCGCDPQVELSLRLVISTVPNEPLPLNIAVGATHGRAELCLRS